MTHQQDRMPIHDTARNPADEFRSMGVYVAVTDVGRSTAFYEGLFARKPTIVLDDFIGFTIGGGLFAVVSRERYHTGSSPGSGSVPYIAVDGLDIMRSRAATGTGEPKPDIITEPGIRLLKLLDPDGQIIEFYSLTGGY